MNQLTTRLAWPLAIVSGTLTAAGLIMLALTIDRPMSGLWGFRGFAAIFAIETAFLGALIMSRRPDNVIGLLFAIAGLTNSIQLFTSEYLVAGADGSLPALEWMAWVNAFIWVPTVGVILGFVLLLFPDGQLLSPRWKPVAWLIGVSTAGAMALIAVQPNAGGGGSAVPYPFDPPFDRAAIDGLFWLVYLGITVGIALAIGSVWVRWRRSSGVEREQLKWLAWAGAIVVMAIPVSFLPFRWAQVVFILAVATVPLAVGIAVLRYRLYEIDAVISRTLVIGGLTAILAGLFAALQRLLQAVFTSVTGNESDAALVITTLILATLFAPLKKWLEKLVELRVGARAVSDHGAAPTWQPDEVPATVGGDLESMLRRVVREEVRAALAVPVDQGANPGP